MIIAKSTLEWAKQHAERYPDGFWRCRRTGKKLYIKRIYRMIGAEDDFPFNGLEVRGVGHVYCHCVPNPEFPEAGTPIRLDDLDGYKL